MVENDIRVEGAVVYWTARRTDLAKVKAAWEDLGFGSLVPERRKGIQLLRDALMAQFPSNGNPRLVRRLKDTSALSVVTEHRGQSANRYSLVQAAKLAKDGTIETDPPNPAVVDQYDKLALVAPGNLVGHILIKALRKLQGITLRATGGIYWVPPDAVDKFRQLVEAVEEAGDSTVYVMSTQFDDKTAEAVRDGLAQEVKQTAADLIEQLSRNDITERGIAGKRKRAERLLVKVKKYEAILGTVLTDVRATIDEIEVAASAVDLVAAGM